MCARFLLPLRPPSRGPDVPSRGATQEFLRPSSGSWKVPLTLIICAWQQERVRFASPEGFEVPMV